jgi:putative oxidoreductase
MTQENPVLAFVARLCLVLIFPFSALDKIFNHQSATSQAADGLIAVLLLVLGGTLEVIGPICILFGFYRRQAALLFVFYVIATAVLFHNFWSFPVNSDMWNEHFWEFLKNFGLAGGFVYVAGDAPLASLRPAFSLKPR